MIRVLIVDDSPTEATLIQNILAPEVDMTVVGIAKNGQEAVDLTKALKPDLITMDINMPIMDGLQATRIIMMQQPTPIVVISSTVNDESVHAVFPILEAGALTALPKPSNIFEPSFEATRKQIVATLRAMAEIHVVAKPIMNHPSLKTPVSQPKLVRTPQHYELLAIGASVGGPLAIKTILSEMTVNFPMPILITQHMVQGFIQGFVDWLKSEVSLPVSCAKHQEIFQKGRVYFAPEGMHLSVNRTPEGLMSVLTAGSPVDGFLPSITVLFQSVAKICNGSAIGVLLTGMGHDGAEGLLAMRQAKNLTLVQGPESSIVYGMGSIAESMNAVDAILELPKLAKWLAHEH